MKKTILSLLMLTSAIAQSWAQDWTTLNTPLGGNIFATHRSGTNVYGTLSTGGFAKSTDGGTNWTSDTAGIPKGTPILLGVTSSGNVLMGKMDLGGPNGNFPMYYSSNAGTSWTPISGVNATAGTLVTGPTNKVLMIPTYNGFSTMKVSGDGGMTWNNTTVIAKGASFDPAGKIYAVHYNSSAGKTELVVSQSNDSTYAVVAGSNIHANTEKIYIATNGNIYVSGGSPKPMFSTNAGSSFNSMDSAYTNVWADGANNLFVTLSASVCLRQASGSGSWTNISSGIGAFGISGFFFQDNGNVFATSGASLLKFNGGSTGIDPLSGPDVLIYPNPAVETLFLSGINPVQVRLYNSTGQQVYAGNESTIGVSQLATGIYVVLITSRDNPGVISRKVHIAH